MDDKVYTNEVIQDTPFPQQDPGVSTTAVSSSANQVHSPTTIQETPLPLPRIAQELLSEKLNTRTRKILGEFQFTPSGAIQIGDYTQGVTGDVRISPNGILGRNALGDTTFGLDTDGNAVFAGTLQANTIIGGSGAVRIEETLAGNGRIVLYNGNIPAIVIGDPA